MNNQTSEVELRLYSLEDLTERFGVSVRTWREYIKRKELTAYKIGKRYFIYEYDLAEFIKEREAYPWRQREKRTVW